jgi:hypothetical protein
MTIEDFQKSLAANDPPASLPPALAALWWEQRGDWNRAHHFAQQDKGTNGAWVHAYLHRKEGDRENAAGWYKRAGKPFCETSLSEEWFDIAQALLSHDFLSPTA